MYQHALGAVFLAAALSCTQVKAQVESTTYVQADHILVETQESASAALNMIKAGAPFHALAFRWSEDVGSGKVGGQLDVARCDSYVPEFASFVCTAELLEPGIVKTVFGWHIAVVRSRSTNRQLVAPPNPVLRAPEFKPTVSLSCGFPGVSGSMPVEIDVPNLAARFANRPALVQSSEVEFRLQRTNGVTVVIDRTTGLAVIHEPGKEALPGLTCRTSSQRLF